MPPKRTECDYCHKKYGCHVILEHYASCLMFTDERAKSGLLVRFFSYGITGEVYYMYARVGSNCTLYHIKNFLKKTWCNCCDHSDQFYLIEDIGIEGSGLLYEVDKSAKLTDFGFGQMMQYDYDMGNTTSIYFVIVNRFDGEESHTNIDILKKNDLFKFKCKKCTNDATVYEQEHRYYVCDICSKKSTAKFKLVDSPRSGVCNFE